MQRRQFLRAAGASAGAVGAAGTAAPVTAQDDEEDAEDGEDDGEDDAPAGQSVEVTVGPGGNLEFDPASIEVPPGTTVVWEWDSDDHNVNPIGQPDDADWEGHPDVVDPPNTYEYTFDVEGTYEYECTPHVAADMFGEVVVDPNATLGQGGAGAARPTVPASAMSIGIGITAAMSSTVALAFFFLKYGSRSEE